MAFYISDENGNLIKYAGLGNGSGGTIDPSLLDNLVKIDDVQNKQLYARNNQGVVAGISYDINPTENSFPTRGVGAVLKVGTPQSDEDATTKVYVDTALDKKVNILSNTTRTVESSSSGEVTSTTYNLTNFINTDASGVISINSVAGTYDSIENITNTTPTAITGIILDGTEVGPYIMAQTAVGDYYADSPQNAARNNFGITPDGIGAYIYTLNTASGVTGTLMSEINAEGISINRTYTDSINNESITNMIQVADGINLTTMFGNIDDLEDLIVFSMTKNTNEVATISFTVSSGSLLNATSLSLNSTGLYYNDEEVATKTDLQALEQDIQQSIVTALNTEV